MHAILIVELVLYQTKACLPRHISKKLFQNNLIQMNLFRAKVEPKAALKRLSNGSRKKDSTTQQGMQKGANFCTTLPLLYHTSF